MNKFQWHVKAVQLTLSVCGTIAGVTDENGVSNLINIHDIEVERAGKLFKKKLFKK